MMHCPILWEGDSAIDAGSDRRAVPDCFVRPHTAPGHPPLAWKGFMSSGFFFLFSFFFLFFGAFF